MLLIPAYAKANLCLAVRGRRRDGFHDIDSVAVAIDWHDIVGVAMRTAPSTAVRLVVAGAGAGGPGTRVPDGTDNLAVRAAEAVAGLVGPVELDIWLDKRLPSLSGLGGGSSDAAAVLRACVSLLAAGAAGPVHRGDLDAGTLHRVAASLGSDVPLLLAGGAQRVRGRGESLEPLELQSLHLAVAFAGAGSTAAAYGAVTDLDLEDAARPDRVAAALARGDAPADDDLGSGLEAPACRASPALGEALAALRAGVPAARWHLTGSGGAAFALARSAEGARETAAAARRLGFAARACRALTSG